MIFFSFELLGVFLPLMIILFFVILLCKMCKNHRRRIEEANWMMEHGRQTTDGIGGNPHDDETIAIAALAREELPKYDSVVSCDVPPPSYYDATSTNGQNTTLDSLRTQTRTNNNTYTYTNTSTDAAIYSSSRVGASAHSAVRFLS